MRETTALASFSWKSLVPPGCCESGTGGRARVNDGEPTEVCFHGAEEEHGEEREETGQL